MKAMINGCGIEFPHEETRSRLEYGHVFSKALVLCLQLLDLLELHAGDPVAAAGIDLSLVDPATQRLLAHALLTGDGFQRLRQGLVLTPVLLHQPHRPGTDLLIDHFRHDCILSNSKRCGIKPGALHFSQRPCPHQHRCPGRSHRRNKTAPPSGGASFDFLI